MNDPTDSMKDGVNPNYIERKLQPLRRSSDRMMQQASTFVASLEIMGDGVILLNSRRSINFISKTAEIILPKLGDVVEITDNKFSFRDFFNQEVLIKMLNGSQKEGEIISVSDVMVIERSNVTCPLFLTLFFVSTANEEPCLMLVFRDPDKEPTPQWEIFTRHFNLSAVEAKLALSLTDGLSINQYSEKFFISPHTTRTHLKSVFTKTGTRRQSDLLRLIFAFTRL